jgi:hypothetical protein
MIFNLKDYKKGRYAMHCPDHEKATIFLRYLHNQGKHWCNGISYLEQDNYNSHRDQTCYAFNEGTYSYLDYFLSNDEVWKLLRFDDFEWEEFRDLELTEQDNQEFSQFISQFSQQGASVNYGV